jgi:hypothetical protein
MATSSSTCVIHCFSSAKNETKTTMEIQTISKIALPIFSVSTAMYLPTHLHKKSIPPLLEPIIFHKTDSLLTIIKRE